MKWLNVLLIFLPIAVFLEVTHGSPTLIFLSAALAILPLAGIMGQATEQLAVRAGSTVGGLLNATFGNATELIIAFFALQAGKLEVVKASIIGSMLGNLLLVMGLAVFLGGLKYKEQRFNLKSATTVASLLAISVIALMIPTIFDLAARGITPGRIEALDVNLSDATAVVLILVYLAYIYFTLVSHRDILSTADDPDAHDEHEGPLWSVPYAVGVLAAATIAVAFMSEFLVGTLDAATAALGLTEFFVGLILIPIIGNAAEHAAAVLFALRNKMDLSMTISLGSTVQVALLVAPLLVLAGLLVGQPMNLVVTPLELAAIGAAVVIAGSVVRDGETNWLEGLLLLAVYVILALAVFFYPLP
ncbi:calcium/proton exchanger [Deinococcus metallilatus]|uniref:Ca(2+)/H(+) antiporter n=1 Tax=Deinococcus metallilatus TaxID=1211322 RepID=A0AAJ5F5G5_9DEIO|nr:calcium/proton exchanger [Deinococcus metallilatus]MBB5294136.1 Ca2+:H+ antiporter [Deinococcus metallilatus]QBY08919.1 calcium/proton exchanger [Deinococcus metallilatus]RXJ10063.1 calcium/proton exchanger [Deinococcus metallilatus]TLK28000.1 calcium/proton exchanger [Deinococcus metallilatus]GMA16528.1 calcium/proton exchanger [Deinococcus metallilatus]